MDVSKMSKLAERMSMIPPSGTIQMMEKAGRDARAALELILALYQSAPKKSAPPAEIQTHNQLKIIFFSPGIFGVGW